MGTEYGDKLGDWRKTSSMNKAEELALIGLHSCASNYVSPKDILFDLEQCGLCVAGLCSTCGIRDCVARALARVTGCNGWEPADYESLFKIADSQDD